MMMEEEKRVWEKVHRRLKAAAKECRRKAKRFPEDDEGELIFLCAAEEIEHLVRWVEREKEVRE